MAMGLLAAGRLLLKLCSKPLHEWERDVASFGTSIDLVTGWKRGADPRVPKFELADLFGCLPAFWSGREELKHRHTNGGCLRAVPRENQPFR